jgi:cytochrome c-type biogenesis protein CcmE
MSIKKTIGWTFAGLGILLIVIIVAALLYLRTNSFRRFALGEIVKQADQATGGRTEIGGLDFKLSTLTAHL